MPGKVYLVGAGPGDPGLITVKGAECLGRADVVLYDRLLDPALLDLAPETARRVFVGKERDRQAMSQAEINQFLVDEGSAGPGLNKVVVRLKGGDPFVFGRGGEEALALARAGVPYEVVPGVTSAVAAPAYAGIPLTHRGLASSFTVVSGSEDPSKANSSVKWDALARTGGTLVVLMGWQPLQSILDTLAKEGMPSDTPVALVQWGTWPRQATVTGNLGNAVAMGKEAGLRPPVAAVIGPVAALRRELAWFDRRPLFGKKVLITRSRTQASQFRTLLEELGAQAVEVPAIQTVGLDDYSELDSALARLGSSGQWSVTSDQGPLATDARPPATRFRWAIFASVNAVDSVFDRLEKQGRDSRAFGGVMVGAIGPSTRDVLSRRGIAADFVPSRSVSEVALAELEQYDWTDVPVLLPAADIGRDTIERGLSARGAKVERIAAYRTIPAEGMAEKAREVLASGIDFVTFTSSSTVTNLLDMLDGDKTALERSITACIGPASAATAAELGLRVDLVAPVHTVQGLVNALVERVASNQ